tara:strand:- start:1573 stop:1974 length:402 start_codon:yes stop_codon:yes gene_type:complete
MDIIDNDAAIKIISERIHLEAWASWYEEEGGSLSGMRVEDCAPPAPPQAAKVAAAILRRCRDLHIAVCGGQIATDIACHYIGSGGGSGESEIERAPSGEYFYYTGSDGKVYVWCEDGIGADLVVTLDAAGFGA